MLIYATVLGFLFALLVHYTLKILCFSPPGQKFTERKIAEFLQKNEVGEEAINLLFNSLSLDEIAHEKIKVVITAIKREFAIPPVFFLPSLEEKIINKGKIEFNKLALELKQKAILETNNLQLYTAISKKIFLFFDKDKFKYLWGSTAIAFGIGFLLSLAAHGLLLLGK